VASVGNLVWSFWHEKNNSRAAAEKNKFFINNWVFVIKMFVWLIIWQFYNN